MEILVFVSEDSPTKKIIENKTLSKIVISFTKKIKAISTKYLQKEVHYQKLKIFYV